MSRHRKIRQDEPLYIILDAGNTDVKAMIHTHFGDEICFPQAVLKIPESAYKQLDHSYSMSSNESETLLLKRDGVGYLVGKDATVDGQNLVGVSKYTRDHLGVLFEAAIYALYPEGHQDVRVVILHPPKIAENGLRAIFKSLKGSHKFTVASDKTPREYVVRDIIDLDEPVAALNTFMLTEQGKQFTAPGLNMIPGKEFLVLDIGGGISSFISGQILRNGRVHLNHQSAEPMEIGIVDVLKSLQEQLMHHFASILPFGLNSLPASMLMDALIEEKVTISGHSYPCEAQAASAMHPLAAKIQKSYRDDFSLGVNAIGIIISGGGGAVSGDYISKHVLHHDFIERAEGDFEKMRFSAVRGASKGLINHLINKSREAIQNAQAR